MPAAAQETDFLELQNHIKAILIKALKLKTLAAEELLAILFLLGQAQTRAELENFCGIFASSFPLLTQIGEEKLAVSRTGIEEKVKKAMAKIVHKDPVLATKIAKAAMKPGITWEELKIQFPQLEQ